MNTRNFMKGIAFIALSFLSLTNVQAITAPTVTVTVNPKAYIAQKGSAVALPTLFTAPNIYTTCQSTTIDFRATFISSVTNSIGIVPIDEGTNIGDYVVRFDTASGNFGAQDTSSSYTFWQGATAPKTIYARIGVVKSTGPVTTYDCDTVYEFILRPVTTPTLPIIAIVDPYACGTRTTTFTATNIATDANASSYRWETRGSNVGSFHGNITAGVTTSAATVTWNNVLAPSVDTIRFNYIDNNTCPWYVDTNIHLYQTPGKATLAQTTVDDVSTGSWCSEKTRAYTATNAINVGDNFEWVVPTSDSISGVLGTNTQSTASITWTTAVKGVNASKDTFFYYRSWLTNGGVDGASSGACYSDTTQLPVTVYPLPEAALAQIDPAAGVCNATEVTFRATLTTGYKDASWNFTWQYREIGGTATTGQSSPVTQDNGTTTVDFSDTPVTDKAKINYGIKVLTDGKGCVQTYDDVLAPLP